MREEFRDPVCWKHGFHIKNTTLTILQNSEILRKFVTDIGNMWNFVVTSKEDESRLGSQWWKMVGSLVHRWMRKMVYSGYMNDIIINTFSPGLELTAEPWKDITIHLKPIKTHPFSYLSMGRDRSRFRSVQWFHEQVFRTRDHRNILPMFPSLGSALFLFFR